MRKIEHIIVHCTGSRDTTTVADVKTEFVRKGWKNPGYHYLVDRDGHIHQLLDEEQVANGVKGVNVHSVHVAWMGGVDAGLHPVDNRTVVQKVVLKVLLKRLKKKYPDAAISGHRDWAPKDCPCFDAKTEYAKI